MRVLCVNCVYGHACLMRALCVPYLPTVCSACMPGGCNMRALCVHDACLIRSARMALGLMCAPYACLMRSLRASMRA